METPIIIQDKDNKKSYTIDYVQLERVQKVLMLTSEAGEGIGIDENDLFELLDKYFREKF